MSKYLVHYVLTLGYESKNENFLPLLQYKTWFTGFDYDKKYEIKDLLAYDLQFKYFTTML